MSYLSKFAPVLAVASALTTGCASKDVQEVPPNVPTVLVAKVSGDARENVTNCLISDEMLDRLNSDLMPIFESYVDMPPDDFFKRFRSEKDVSALFREELLIAAQRLRVSEVCQDNMEQNTAEAAEFLFGIKEIEGDVH